MFLGTAGLSLGQKCLCVLESALFAGGFRSVLVVVTREGMRPWVHKALPWKLLCTRVLASPPAGCGAACVGKRQIFLLSFTKAKHMAKRSLRMMRSPRGAFGHGFSMFCFIFPRTPAKRERRDPQPDTGTFGGTRGVFPASRTCQERGEEGPGTVPSRAEVRSNRAMAA